MRYLVFFTVPKKSMFSRLLEVLSSDRPINFQDRLVVTASHPPRRRVKLACKRQVRVSLTESKYSYHNANLCYYSSIKFLLDIALDVRSFANIIHTTAYNKVNPQITCISYHKKMRLSIRKESFFKKIQKRT